MKKFLSLVMAMVMSFSLVTFASAAELKDVSGHANEEAMEVLYDLEIILGYGDGYFRPDSNITRGEVCAIITRTLVGEDACEIHYPDRFDDVSNLSKLRKYVDTAYDLGIMQGYGNGWFGLTDNVTYNQMAAIITRALGYSAENMGGVWPENVNSVALDIGLFENVAGYGTVPATRGDVAQMIFNAFDCYMVKAVGYGVFMPTKDLFIEHIGFDYDKSVMVEINRATFGHEVMTYTKDKKTVTTDFVMTEMATADLYDIDRISKGYDMIVKYGKTKEVIEINDKDDMEYYKNGEIVEITDLVIDEPVNLIYKNNKLIRVVQWIADDPKMVNMTVKQFEKTFTEIVGDEYAPNDSVITTYGDFAVEVSNECFTGRIAEISTVKNSDDIRITFKSGDKYVIPAGFVETMENKNAGAFVEIRFDYAGEVFSVVNY